MILLLWAACLPEEGAHADMRVENVIARMKANHGPDFTDEHEALMEAVLLRTENPSRNLIEYFLSTNPSVETLRAFVSADYCLGEEESEEFGKIIHTISRGEVVAGPDETIASISRGILNLRDLHMFFKEIEKAYLPAFGPPRSKSEEKDALDKIDRAVQKTLRIGFKLAHRLLLQDPNIPHIGNLFYVLMQLIHKFTDRVSTPELNERIRILEYSPFLEDILAKDLSDDVETILVQTDFWFYDFEQDRAKSTQARMDRFRENEIRKGFSEGMPSAILRGILDRRQKVLAIQKLEEFEQSAREEFQREEKEGRLAIEQGSPKTTPSRSEQISPDHVIVQLRVIQMALVSLTKKTMDWKKLLDGALEVSVAEDIRNKLGKAKEEYAQLVRSMELLHAQISPKDLAILKANGRDQKGSVPLIQEKVRLQFQLKKKGLEESVVEKIQERLCEINKKEEQIQRATRENNAFYQSPFKKLAFDRENIFLESIERKKRLFHEYSEASERESIFTTSKPTFFAQ